MPCRKVEEVCQWIRTSFRPTSPSTMADTFKMLSSRNMISESNARNLAKAVGFRNIAAHQYEAIDNKIVFAIVKNNLKDFVEFAASVSKL